MPKFPFAVAVLLAPFLLSPAAHQSPVALARPWLPAEQTWEKLFDGKTLKNWELTNFGGQGNVTVENDAIVLEFGNDLTGITWTGEVPRINYEVQLEAMRVEGSDFFCGLTFPVNESHCSLIVGGWGGTVVGLSSIDGQDASENTTSQVMSFDRKRWYRIRIQVHRAKIEAWIDDKKVVSQEIEGRKVSIRPEVDLSRPFGIASWRTRAALRAIQIRSLVQF